MESVPEIFEYPSESSLMDDTSASTTSNGSPIGHSVPSLGGKNMFIKFQNKNNIFIVFLHTVVT